MPSNYSFIDETLAGSAKPYQIDDIAEFLEDDITIIISLTPNLPLVSRYISEDDIKFEHYPVWGRPDEEQIDSFLKLIRQLRKKRERAVVHCEYGQERTGMFLAAYLIEIKEYSLDEAIEWIRENRPSSLRNQSSIQFLQDRYG